MPEFGGSGDKNTYFSIRIISCSSSSDSHQVKKIVFSERNTWILFANPKRPDVLRGFNFANLSKIRRIRKN